MTKQDAPTTTDAERAEVNDAEIDLLVKAYLGDCGPQATRVYDFARAVLAKWGAQQATPALQPNRVMTNDPPEKAEFWEWWVPYQLPDAWIARLDLIAWHAWQAARASSEAAQWMPIESAPRDGTAFIGAIELNGSDGRHWWEQHTIHDDGEGGAAYTGGDYTGWDVSDYHAWRPLSPPPTFSKFDVVAPPAKPADTGEAS